jgi:hypothetical protein
MIFLTRAPTAGPFKNIGLRVNYRFGRFGWRDTSPKAVSRSTRRE